MGFAEAVRSCLRQYVGFRGRARRAEYWWFVLAVFLAGLVATLVDTLFFDVPSPSSGFDSVEAPGQGYAAAAWASADQGPTASLLGLLTLLPSLSVAIRRLHDTDRSGWFLLLPLAIALVVPILALLLGQLLGGAVAGVLWMLALLAVLLLPLWWFIQKGTRGPNRFGPDPVEVAQ